MSKRTASKVPQIRFKGFSGDWVEKKLGELTPLRGGFAFQSSQFCEVGIPIIKISNVLPSGNIGGVFAFYGEQEKDINYSLPNNAALLAMSGATTGKVSILKKQHGLEKFYQNQRVGYFQDLGISDYSFISTLVRSHFFAEKLDSVLVAGAQPNVSSKEIDNFDFQIPKHKTEQQKIGGYFREVDRLIGLHQRKHDKLVTLKKAMLQKMFPQPGATTPEIRFKGFAGDWVEKKIHELFQVTRGNVLAATKTSPKQTKEAPYPVYSSQTKNNGLMGYYKSYLFEDAITWTTDGANAGTVRYREGKFYSTNVNGVLLSDRGYANRAVSESLNQEAWKHVSHVGNPKLMNNVMSQIKIFVPDTIAEQQKIGTYFRTLDSLISKHAIQLQKLTQIKSACLERMFV